MRHYVAVQDENGRWFYANEGQHRRTGEYGWVATGACTQRPLKQCPKCEGRKFSENAVCDCDYGLVEDPDATPCPGHDTAAEAYAHQKQHMLARHAHFYPDSEKGDTRHRCKVEGCDEFTNGGGHVGGYRTWALCAKHRNRESIEPLYCVGESWES